MICDPVNPPKESRRSRASVANIWAVRPPSSYPRPPGACGQRPKSPHRVTRVAASFVCTDVIIAAPTKLNDPPPAPPSAGSGVKRCWYIIPCGLLAGALWGAVARLWMRWVSTEPEFSWSGTLFIVGAFAIFGMLQGVAMSSRRRGRRRPRLTLARVAGVIGTLPLFVGAGALMLPTVIAGGLAVWRGDWPRWVRVVLGIVGCLPIAVVVTSTTSDFGIVGGVPRCLGLVALYGVVVGATRSALTPQRDGWRAPAHCG